MSFPYPTSGAPARRFRSCTHLGGRFGYSHLKEAAPMEGYVL
jgi:hypothetical protein